MIGLLPSFSVEQLVQSKACGSWLRLLLLRFFEPRHTALNGANVGHFISPASAQPIQGTRVWAKIHD